MAMNCTDFQEHASRFIDGKLEARGQIQLFVHLSGCTDCRSFLATAVRVRELIQKDPATLPPGLDEELFERLSGRHVPESSPSDKLRRFYQHGVTVSYPLAAAALLLVVLASLLFSIMFMRTNSGDGTLQSVLGTEPGGAGRQTVVVVYQLPEEQVVTMPPSRIFEVKARTVQN
jgi:hypothetical protein